MPPATCLLRIPPQITIGHPKMVVLSLQLRGRSNAVWWFWNCCFMFLEVLMGQQFRFYVYFYCWIFFSGELMFFLLSRFLLFNWVLLIVFLFGQSGISFCYFVGISFFVVVFCSTVDILILLLRVFMNLRCSSASFGVNVHVYRLRFISLPTHLP